MSARSSAACRSLTQADAPGVVRATVAMIAAAVRPTADNLAIAAPRPQRRPARPRPGKYIESHLQDPALNPDAICAALRISRSRLYALFERFNGVSSYIQDRRLARIHAILADGNDSRLISTIAQSFGFTQFSPLQPSIQNRIRFRAAGSATDRQRPHPANRHRHRNGKRASWANG